MPVLLPAFRLLINSNEIPQRNYNIKYKKVIKQKLLYVMKKILIQILFDIYILIEYNFTVQSLSNVKNKLTGVVNK